MGINFHVTHNLSFHISDCHIMQLSKQKKATSEIVENSPRQEQKNLRKAWFNKVSFSVALTPRELQWNWELHTNV